MADARCVAVSLLSLPLLKKMRFVALTVCESPIKLQALDELLQDDERFGFIVMDGNGTLYGTLQGR